MPKITKPKNVYSNTRLITQPPINIDGLLMNTKQTMDGLILLTKIPSNAIPLVFFDPQYRHILDKQAYGNEGARQKQRALLPQMTEATICRFLNEIERVLIPSGHLMLWIDKYMLCTSTDSLLSHSNLHLVDMITWNKRRMGMGYRTRRYSEFLLVLQKSPKRAKGVWKIHNIPDVWDEKVDSVNHTHTKPIQLQAQLILAVTNEGDIVVDPAAGSYSVMTATINTKRNFIGCDISGDFNND
ncbi:hypothetical protein LCGC14_1391620 [marine sediment metagenome]|uniref:DNA methylase N-4/N-6 domain-containing protein n=1 Tax=marine sediment metagenome TaxID=412755 RepID=A0A0F9N1F3_9ZZZZ